MRIDRLCLTILFSLSLLPAASQQITMEDLPYRCDFEDDTENMKWVLNPGLSSITTNNAWVIGDSVAYTGEKALYITNDAAAATPPMRYANTNNVLLAYRDIQLDQGQYDIAYDWMGAGNGKNGYLKVVFANRPSSSISCLGNSAEPSWVGTAVQLMGSSTSLNGSDRWTHVQTTVTIPKAQANKTTTRVFFVWVNTSAVIDTTSVAIDNFQIGKSLSGISSTATYPSNIHVSAYNGDATISWDGVADSYEVLYRKKSEDAFSSVTTSTNSITIPNVEYGAYEVWVCCVNGTDKSIYTVFPLIYVYETNCFDALNMYNAAFEYGKWTAAKGLIPAGYDKIDFGAKDIRSRHTTHFDQTEVDPRTIIRSGRDTIACLKTVPEGEYGSIRLGNWNTGAEYESITFQYTVESDANAVLILNYAMVLENPDHSAKDQPRFTIDIVDESGQSIDTECATVDFHSPTATEWLDPEVRALWYESSWQSSSSINWQDWRKIGISLEKYIGQTLTVTVTSYDCSQGGHFGYAYFTLSCTRADVDGLPWGEGSTTQKFTAPGGFEYAWFNREDTLFIDTLATTQEFIVSSSDTATYVCNVTYPSNPDCGFSFDASAKPHTPRAELDWHWVPENCENGLLLYNRCHVVLTNQETGAEEHRYDKHLDQCVLVLPDQTEIELDYSDEGLYMPMPMAGDTGVYVIRTGIVVNDSLYADTAYYTIEIPAIGKIETHLYDTICEGGEVIFPLDEGTRLTETGDYTDSLVSIVTGCDSVVILHLLVNEVTQTHLYDTICAGGTYVFYDKTLTRGGNYNQLLSSTVTGCDSLLTLHLMEAPVPHVTLDSSEVCGAELLIRTQSSEYVSSYHLQLGEQVDTVYAGGETDMVLSADLSAVPAGVYAMIVGMQIADCEEYADTLSLRVNLPSWVVEARFDDVLTLLNENYNGGYRFVAYQWFADGLPIEGANGSWYYLPGLDQTVEYSVEVELEDGNVLRVCPFLFEQRHVPSMLDAAPARKQLKNGRLYIQSGERVYDAQGNLVQIEISEE